MAPTPTPNTPAKPFSLGIIGLDSSHVPEFTRRIHAMRDAGDTVCTVTHHWNNGEFSMPAEEVEKWRVDVESMGVKRADSLEAMLDAVDGVLVLSVNGAKHEEQAAMALGRGLPTYIDKPLANDAASAKRILEAARKSSARCYSASSLRFAPELLDIPRDLLGDIVAVDAFGPGELNPDMPRLLYYGVHTVEMVDAIMGPGVAEVRADLSEPRDFIALRYTDGRSANLRLERVGNYDFGATVHGTKAVHHFTVDFGPVYTRLVAGMVRFFTDGQAPVALRDTVENVAVIEAAHRSIEKGGEWIRVEPID
jgi:predicted dehydrogenase